MAEPKIPEQIVVHLGAPESDAMNVSVSFSDYIKNVASSEIYPTWPTDALKANIIAQASVALNRVYTRFYRNKGYNFDITSSPAYDQTFIYGRDVFANISLLVEEYFNSYIRRENFVEPLFAEFCDGIEVECNGLSQWGSVALAEEGKNYIEILKNYYGEDIVLERNVKIEGYPEVTSDITLREGDTGSDVELLQRQLNRISANFPGIPKIYPEDGFFGESTLSAVKKFQEIFGLTVDGFVGMATKNSIQYIYYAVKRLSTVNSEGIRISELNTRYSDSLSLGSVGEGVLNLQYYLSYISLFVPSVISTSVDGSFGRSTENSVRSFQSTYGLTVNGVVDREVWDRIENVYLGTLEKINYDFYSGRVYPFPGRVLRIGIEGNDVRILQEYLNFISQSYPEIPRVNVDGVFGEKTAEQVRAFKRIFNIPGTEDRVNAPVWNSISNIYDDLYNGQSTRVGQYPGYDVG